MNELTILSEPNSKIQSTVPRAELMHCLSSSMDAPGPVKVLGQVPESRPFIGAVQDASFWIQKKSSLLNPFARKLEGRIVEDDEGLYMEYRFAPSLFSILAGAGGTAAFAIIFLMLTLLAFGISSQGGQESAMMIVFAAGLPLIVTILLWKIGQNASFSSDEEVLDHLRRIASGSGRAS